MNFIFSLLKILIIVLVLFCVLSVFALITIEPVRYGISYSNSQIVNDVFIWVIGMPAAMLNGIVDGEGFTKFFSYRTLADQYFDGATSKGYFLVNSIMYGFSILVLVVIYKILRLVLREQAKV